MEIISYEVYIQKRYAYSSTLGTVVALRISPPPSTQVGTNKTAYVVPWPLGGAAFDSLRGKPEIAIGYFGGGFP